MKPWLARLHRWLGLVVGLQLVLWLASGLTMSLLDPAAVEGAATRAPAPAARPWPQDARAPAAVLALHGRPAERIESGWLLDRPVWHVIDGDRAVLRDARSGQVVRVDAAIAAAVAERDYTGDAAPAAPELLAAAPLEARGHPGPVWRVRFADHAHTALYVSAQDGRVLERRTDAFRLFDIAWMLHIMDYSGRADFNHPLVVAMAGGGTLLALSGVWLLGFGIKHGAFRPRAWRRPVALQVRSGAHGPVETVPAAEDEPVLAALARAGLKLPSQCGGGQTCGQCIVTVEGRAPPASSGDRARMLPERLSRGERLACALRAANGMVLQVPERATLDFRNARVVRVTPVSATLREIVLSPDGPMPPIAAGQFIEIEVPPFAASVRALSDTRAPLPQGLLSAAPEVRNPGTVARAYSPSLPTGLAAGLLPLLVRLEHDASGARVGPGSGYLFSRREGDAVRIRGPFGAFALKPGDREKIFVGGGAGLAPLRAMLRARLAAGGQERMHFWIGARTPAEVAYRDEFTALVASHPNLDVRTVYSESENADGGARWVHDAVHEGLLRSHAALGDCEFYLCGPPAMLAATRELLARIGIDPSRVAYDDFG